MPYPEERATLHRLIREGHATLEDEPLLLAIYYASQIVADEECLFEVARNFGDNDISDDREIFQIQFNPSAGLPLAQGHRLRLLLTNSVEMRQALGQQWPQIQDLQAAIQSGEYSILFLREADAEAQWFADALTLPQAVAA